MTCDESPNEIWLEPACGLRSEENRCWLSCADDDCERCGSKSIRYVRADKAPEDTSDGYHTFKELYDHRLELWIALCRELMNDPLRKVWRSRLHSDGSSFDGWFILGIDKYKPGYRWSYRVQITYHLPNSRWDDCCFAGKLDRAPDYDGHTSADVLERLKRL